MVDDKLKARLFADYLKTRKSDAVYFWATILGLLTGAVFCIAGFVITILGISGSVEWIVEAADFRAKLINAGPGVVFAVLGGVIVWRYKPSRKETIDFNNLRSSIMYHQIGKPGSGDQSHQES